jgi:metallo-beta-lactamase class B
MKKLIKRILVVTGIIIGVLALAFGGMFLKLKSEMSGFAPMETGIVVKDIFIEKNVVDNIYVVKDDYANLFIIQDGEQYIVIDCATDKTTVAEQMKKLDINPDKVVAVFLTHTDQDHVGALGLFDKAKLYISKEEEQMINGKKSKFLWLGNSLSRTDYSLLDDRQIVQIGNLKIEGILVPGHTSGMMAYLINDRYLFTGDILSLKDGRIAPIPSFFNMDTKQAIESMEIIRRIPSAGYIFTAHWGYTDDYETAIADIEVYKSETLIIKQVSKHVYQHISFLEFKNYGKVTCNGMIVANENEAIVFDTPADDKTSSELIDWITKSLKCKITAVISSHYHLDNLGGLNAFHKHDITSYAYVKTKQIAKENNLPEPQQSFVKYLEMKVGDEKVIVEFLGEGHTCDNSIGYFPLEDIMFGGCLIKEIGAGKGNLAEANAEEWPETVKKVKNKFPKVKKVIPGHGKSGGAELLDYTINLFE